jgi:hypothetical protein
VLVSGWSVAAVGQRDGRWARLLVDETGAPGLVSVLAEDDLARVVTASVTVERVLTPLALAALEALPHPWPVAVRADIIDAVVSLFVERRVGRHQTPSLQRLARTLEPALLREMADAIAALSVPPPTDGLRDDLVGLLCFRAGLRDELAARGAA